MTHAHKKLVDRYVIADRILEELGQDHVLQFFDHLDDVSKNNLLDQIESVDWKEVARLIETHVKRKPELTLPDKIEPAPYYPHKPDGDLASRYDLARKMGEQFIREGKVAAFVVAGGQGTRLGWAGPKGTFPATPIDEKPLFRVFAEYLLKVRQKYGAIVPWYVMTSPANHQPTLDFFRQNDFFGLGEENVVMFPQGMFPAFDIQTHKILLSERDSMALSPDGHGGSLKALHASGAIADMRERGIEQISYFQVDNPNVKVVDPLFIGLHSVDKAQMSSKMLPKAYPGEKLGVFCLADGKMTVIEYSDLPEELAEQRLPSGELRFRAGSIAIHVIAVDFVEQLNSGEGFGLAYHRAEKKVPHISLDDGHHINPREANGVKLETFVFDALPLASASIVLETERVEEFAPIKNADAFDEKGKLISVDCPATSQRLQTERAARWLEAAGVTVARDNKGWVDAAIELSPLTAIEPQDLPKKDLPERIDAGQQVRL